MKQCTVCLSKKPLEEFNKRTNSKDGKNNKCKDCQHKYHAIWYKLNNETVKNRVYSRRNAIKNIIKQFKSSGCVDCGITDFRLLDCDHVVGQKKFSMSVAHYHTIQEVIEELLKCEVRCANCHRIVTHLRRMEKLNAKGATKGGVR